MTADQARWSLRGAAAAVLLLIGVGIGYAIWGHPWATPGGPAPEKRQGDGSLVLERQPAKEPPKTPHAIPEGGHVERHVSVTVQPTGGRSGQPDPSGQEPAGGGQAAACGPVRVDLSLVRLEDGSARVVASSPDGEVTGGLDIPVARPGLQLELTRPWATGVSYAGDRAWGVFVQRDIWRVRLGLEVNATTDGGSEARASVGWTF